MSIEKHISQLLFERDCVIIPQFGGFVGNYKSAKLDKITNKFSPPSKEISFNKNLIHNDGLLANRISQQEKKSYEEANSILKNYSDDLKSKLKKREKIEFSQIGVLFSDEHNNIQFEPDYSSNFLIDSFGLQSLHSPLVKKQERKSPLREKTVELRFTDKKPVSNEKTTVSKIRNRKYLKYAAAALPLLLLLLWLPFNLEKINLLGQKAKSINYSNLIPFTEKTTPLYSERKELIIPNSQFTTVNPLLALPDTISFAEISPFDNDEKIIVRMNNFSKIQNSKPKTKNRFHIIGGCFEYRENAEKLVNNLLKKGFNAEIIDKHKGLFRVSFQNFRKRKDALNALAQIKSNHNTAAWLLIK